MTGIQIAQAPGFQAPPIAAEGSTAKARIAPILPLLILTYSYLLFPPEVRLSAGSLLLPLYRLIIIGFLPVILLAFMSGRARFTAVDGMVGLASAWMVISFLPHFGLADGLVRSGALVIDAYGAYLLARVTLSSPARVRMFLILISPGLVLAGTGMMVESLTHTVIVRPFFGAIFGSLPTFAQGVEAGSLSLLNQVRFGLLRAFGPFSHQILAGTILTSLLSVYVLSGIRSWPRRLGLAAAALGLFSMSSAAFLAVIMASILMALEHARRYVRGLTWPLMVAGLIAFLLVLQLVSKNGVVPILVRYTLDPQTGFFRMIIWEWGWKSMMNHPWIGIGYDQYVRPRWMVTSSVDAHFLALGIRHGIIVPLFLLLGAIVTMFALGRAATRVSPLDRRLFVSLNFVLAILLVTSMSVAFFGEANIWFMTMLGMCASMAAWPARQAAGAR